MTRRLAALAVAALLAAALTGCSNGSPDPAPGEARLVDRSGVVESSLDGRTWKRAGEGTLRRGERLRARDGGTAVLALAAGARAELRSGSQVVVGRPLRLVAGDLLVRAGDDTVPVNATSAVASVTAGGDARLTRGLALDAAVYDGAVDVRSGSRTFRLAALRQLSVPGVGLLPEAGEPAQPLQYRPSDRWDREFLSEWMALGDDLQARSNGLSSQVGRDQGRTAGFYRLLLPQLDAEPGFTQTMVDADEALPPGERLVGAAIAVAATSTAPFVDRWSSVFEFRSQGAAWGLVALDQHVRDRPRLVTDVDAALSRVVNRPDVAAAASARAGVAGSSAGGGTGTPTPGAGSTVTTPPPSGGGSGSSPPTTQPSPPTTSPPVVPILPLPTLPPPDQSQPQQPAEPSPSGDTIGQLSDTLVNTVGGLLGGLLPP